MHDVNQNRANAPGFDPRLFLRDEELDYGISLMLAGERALMRAAGGIATQQEIPTLAARVLVALRFQPGQTVTQLREQLDTTVPTMARILGDLDKRDLIERRMTVADGSARSLFLTHEGKRATDPAALAMRDKLRDAYRKAGATSVAGARAMLEALK
jgi:DNA-binding MarR family transcriptional regulator